MRLWEAIYKTVLSFKPDQRPVAALAALFILCLSVVAALFLIAAGTDRAAPGLLKMMHTALLG